jgi:hypothetical protein
MTSAVRPARESGGIRCGAAATSAQHLSYPSGSPGPRRDLAIPFHEIERRPKPLQDFRFFLVIR